MKNLINYYYNLIINDFKRIDGYYLFELDNVKYIFLQYDGNIDELYKIYTTVINNDKYCHEIIMNKDGLIVTFYLNKPYILMKKNIHLTTPVTLDEIINYDTTIYDAKKINWGKLWMNKIDYYEYQMDELRFKYKKLSESFCYYIGMSECAINLLNYVNSEDVKLYISHKRVRYKEDMDSFLNPVNIIFDTRVRDIAEYLKINYINDNITLDYVIDKLEHLNLDYNESILFLSRLIYPSYYFDIYDKIIQDEISEDKINFYIEKNVYYETFLKSIYSYFKTRYRIPNIEWLEN